MGELDDSYTTSLLHFSGADGSSSFVDEGGLTWTAVSGAVLDDAAYKFAPTSGVFTGAACGITTPANNALRPGSDDFTIDFWAKRSSTDASLNIFGQASSDLVASDMSSMVVINSLCKLQFSLYTGSSPTSTTTSDVFDDTASWHHIACIRYADNISIYVDGIQSSTPTAFTAAVQTSAKLFAIGRRGEYDTAGFKGWIDEFRFSKGIARWTANFTPPLGPYWPPAKNQISYYQDNLTIQ